MTNKLGYMQHQKNGGSFRGASREAAARRAANSPKKGIIEGRYNNIQPGTVPLWFHFPSQSYAIDVYDRETTKIIHIPDSPVFACPQHFVSNGITKDKRRGRKGRPHNCSGGVDRSKPCYGCAARARYYAELSQQRAQGIKADRSQAPVGVSTRNAMWGILSEVVCDIPVYDANGKARTTKGGSPIFNHIPEVVLRSQGTDISGYTRTFGYSGHWGFSGSHYEQLGDIDGKLANYCANCAGDLAAMAWMCPECGEYHDDPNGGVMKSDLSLGREEHRKCTRCNHTGPFIPDLACPTCNDPLQGRLFDTFDLRLKAVPAGGESTSTILELVEIRVAVNSQYGKPPANALPYFDREEYGKLCTTALDIPAIYSPDSIAYQKDTIYDPDFIAGLDPGKTSWQEYGEPDEEETSNLFDE